MKIHIARAGDRLVDLIKKYTIGQESLLTANPHLDLYDSLPVGTKVRIPTGRIPMPSMERVKVVARSMDGDSISKESRPSHLAGDPSGSLFPSPNRLPSSSVEEDDVGHWQVNDVPPHDLMQDPMQPMVSPNVEIQEKGEEDPALMLAEGDWLNEHEQVFPEDIPPFCYHTGHAAPYHPSMPMFWGNGNCQTNWFPQPMAPPVYGYPFWVSPSSTAPPADWGSTLTLTKESSSSEA